MFQNPNTAGLFALLNILLLAGALRQARPPVAPGAWTLRAALGLECIAHLFALVASGSRGSWVGAFAALLCLLVCRTGDAPRFPRLLARAGGAAGPATPRERRLRLAGLAVVVCLVLVCF